MLGESGRIHDHQIVLAFRNLPEEIHGIDAEFRMPGRIETIQRDILPDQFDGPLGTVHGIDMDSSRPKGVYRKTTGIAEQIQDVAPCGIFSDQRPILPLIQEKTRLLSLGPVHQELTAILKHPIL